METAKDKAKSLVEKYRQQLPSEHLHYDQIERLAIKCAKIAVDEIINEWLKIDMVTQSNNLPLRSKLSYWQEVKNELNKM